MVAGEEGIAPVQAVVADRSVPGILIDGTDEGKPREEPRRGVANTGGVGTPKAKLLADLIQVCFERDDNTGKIVARLKNSTTGEVLREIPPEEMLKVARMIEQFLGICVDRHS